MIKRLNIIPPIIPNRALLSFTAEPLTCIFPATWTRVPGESSRNAILWKQDNGYEVERLPGIPGETLSMLISDINQDGFPDLMVGNDFQIPEFYYFGQAGGKLKLIQRSDNIFPETTFSTSDPPWKLESARTRHD